MNCLMISGELSEEQSSINIISILLTYWFITEVIVIPMLSLQLLQVIITEISGLLIGFEVYSLGINISCNNDLLM